MIIEKTVIESNSQIAENIWKMVFKSPEISSKYIGAGQFINILPNDDWGHPLRRPMSIASVDQSNLSIIYKIFGDVTESLSKKKPGDTAELLGPIGNTFTKWDLDVFPILIGGGVGLAPILNLKDQCDSEDIDYAIIIGARNSHEQFIEHDPSNLVFLTTDDGSLGDKGTVMVPLDQIIKNHQNPYIFACGPEPMLKAIHELSLKSKITAQLSVESYMGCGVGLCQGCVINKNTNVHQKHSYHEKYSLVCLDGPVYEAKDINFV